MCLPAAHNTNLHIGDGAHHALPEGQQVVDTVGCKLPHIQGLHSELGNQLNGIRIVFHCHQLPQLVIALQPQQQPTKLVKNTPCTHLKKMRHILHNLSESPFFFVYTIKPAKLGDAAKQNHQALRYIMHQLGPSSQCGGSSARLEFHKSLLCLLPLSPIAGLMELLAQQLELHHLLQKETSPSIIPVVSKPLLFLFDTCYVAPELI
ncbi:hypothetical protein E2C01_009631 [Portunus trituberculatus]|uniref:Uncharacterized protein n=1 Tax=Portunus trituberculatus TaxID=210409 RepID=A0A5B7D6A9_PORTR|nr:hypothetical protein [Portunus trituberculatus]